MIQAMYSCTQFHKDWALSNGTTSTATLNLTNVTKRKNMLIWLCAYRVLVFHKAQDQDQNVWTENVGLHDYGVFRSITKAKNKWVRRGERHLEMNRQTKANIEKGKEKKLCSYFFFNFLWPFNIRQSKWETVTVLTGRGFSQHAAPAVVLRSFMHIFWRTHLPFQRNQTSEWKWKKY